MLHAQIPYWQSTASCRLAHISNRITSNTSSSAFPKCWNHLLILPQPQKNSTYFGILFLFSFVFNGRDLFSIARIRSVRSCLSHWIDTQTSPRVSPSSLLMLWLWLPLSSPLPFSISIPHVLAFPLPILHFQSYPFQINLLSWHCHTQKTSLSPHCTSSKIYSIRLCHLMLPMYSQCNIHKHSTTCTSCFNQTEWATFPETLSYLVAFLTQQPSLKCPLALRLYDHLSLPIKVAHLDAPQSFASTSYFGHLYKSTFHNLSWCFITNSILVAFFLQHRLIADVQYILLNWMKPVNSSDGDL